MKTNAELAKTLIDNSSRNLTECKIELIRANSNLNAAIQAEKDFNNENRDNIGPCFNPFVQDQERARKEIERARLSVEDAQAMYDFIVNRICAEVK